MLRVPRWSRQAPSDGGATVAADRARRTGSTAAAATRTARVLVVLCVIVGASGAGLALRSWRDARAVQQYLHTNIVVPADAPADLLRRWFDVTPVTVIQTAAWEKFAIVVPRYVLQSDPTIWARMHFADWDRLAPAERQAPLGALLDRSGAVIHAGDCWPVMTPADWDSVPQPVRAVALLGVIEYWTRRYAVGESHGHAIADMVRTVQAILMSESWFEHRTVVINLDGSQDLGMAGASAYARGVLRAWHERGQLDFAFADEQYVNPWHAARFAAFWFNLMLDEADGDVERAIRAYNVGISRARRDEGTDYLAGVLRRRRQYMRGPSPSPTWTAIREWRAHAQASPRPRCRPSSPAAISAR